MMVHPLPEKIQEPKTAAKIPMTAVILAGGKSSRMGQDKALLKFGEETILEYLARLSSSLFTETFIVISKNKNYDSLDLSGATIFTDFFENHGPLAGLYTGLSYSMHQASCVLTCDMPFVDEALLRELAGSWQEHYDAICFQDPSGRLQPFPGIYLRSSRYFVRLLLDRSEISVKRLLDILVVNPFPLSEKRMKALLNMNTLEDYQYVLEENKRWSKK